MKRNVKTLPRERQILFNRTMKKLDSEYDDAAGMLGLSEPSHGVRVSAHYALGLFARGEAGDRERGRKVLSAILDLQMKASEEDIYYGVFKQRDNQPDPPAEPYPGPHIDKYARYWLDRWQETVQNRFLQSLGGRGFTKEQLFLIKKDLKSAVVKTIPVVWDTYDPNWREFIGCIFAMILTWFEDGLSAELIIRMKEAMNKAVTGSARRYEQQICPMNTNIELMHIFICGFYGGLLGEEKFSRHSLCAAKAFLERYQEFHSVSEFNSPTYYGVDLMCAALLKQLSPQEELKRMGESLEEGIWKDLADFYNPVLRNICPPFSRSYEMDMAVHTSIPVLLYLGLGAEAFPLPAVNSETAGDIDFALLGTAIPSEIRESLIHFGGNRQITRQYRELIERGDPDNNSPLCTARAWIEENYMLGGMKGSRNTSGQLRAAAAYWKAPDGSVSYLALLRRAPGERENTHYRTVYLNTSVDQNRMDIDVTFEVEQDMELYFEIAGSGMRTASIDGRNWVFPGMTVYVESDSPVPEIRMEENRAEIVYAYSWTKRENPTMKFRLTFEPQKMAGKPACTAKDTAGEGTGSEETG